MENDLKLNNCLNVFSKKEDAESLKKILFKHYLSIKNLFYLIACNSSYPTIEQADFTSFLNGSGILNKT